ncbi:MAG: hypothetical protein V1844_09985 [Pseudomonadota bacterium]
MKSQSNEYPIVTQYDNERIAVPINITDVTRYDPMGESQLAYEYDLLIVQANNPSPKTIASRKLLINIICQAIILNKFPLIYQANVANGLYPDSGMKNWIAEMIQESNRCHDLLDTTGDATPAWPIYVEV